MICGNDICEEGENYQNCPQDCPQPQVRRTEELSFEEIAKRLKDWLPLITGIILIIVMAYISLKAE